MCIEHNNLATTLCKSTFFSGLDGTLIGKKEKKKHTIFWFSILMTFFSFQHVDSRIAGNVINKFATTLQSTTAYRMKMVNYTHTKYA